MAKRKNPEKIIENEILDFLKSIGIFCFKIDRQGTFDPVRMVFRSNHNPHKLKGVSDIFAVIAGRMVAIEVKSQKGRVTPEQREFIVRVNEEGGAAFVARSVEQTINQLMLFFPANDRLRQLAKQFSQEIVSKKH